MVVALTGLTDKQEHFVQCLLKGMTQVDAFKAAYDCSGYSSDAAIYVDASRLADKPNVVLRLKELTKAVDDDTVLSLREKYQICAKIARNDEARDRDRLVAVDTDNKMRHLYIQNVDAHIEITLTYDGSKPAQIVDAPEVKELPSGSEHDVDSSGS